MDINHNIERNIVKEILRECSPKNITPNEHFVAFFIKLLLLDPNWGITDDFMTSRENVAKFVAFTISQLESKNDPKLSTLEMQFYFTCNLDNMNNVVKRNREYLSDQLAPLMNKICQINNPNSEDEIEDLTKMVIYYVTLISGLGNPQEIEVYDEALAAFNSVVDKEEVKEFMGLSLAGKKSQIMYLMKIITGLRLYNKDCDLGGAEIFNLPSLLEKAVSTIKGEAHATLKKVIDKVNTLTTIVDSCYTLVQGEDEYFKMVCTLPNQIKKQDIEHVKDMLIFYRQCELYIRKVMEKLDNIDNLSYIIYERFQCSLREIYQIMEVRIAIPAITVFPLFETLANNWSELQNQVIILARYKKIMVNLIGFTKNVHCSKTLLNKMLENTKPLTDVERLRKTNKFKINSLNPEVKVTKLQNFVNISNIHLQYLGFCCWKLVETKGGLIPGNRNMGVAIYKKKNFIFSTPPGCARFSNDPEGVIHEVLNLGRKKPHLIHFLNIKDELLEVLDISELSKKRQLLKKTKEKKVNTKYVFRSEIDRNYYWNVWDFKKQALQMANLSKRKTVSTQTPKSHFINTVNTQTYEMREKEVQTKKDNYTNVPKPSTFIYGLRGRRDDKQFILDLTEPLSKH